MHKTRDSFFFLNLNRELVLEERSLKAKKHALFLFIAFRLQHFGLTGNDN